MESQPQNPEFRINPENFHPCTRPGSTVLTFLRIPELVEYSKMVKLDMETSYQQKKWCFLQQQLLKFTYS